MSAHHSGSGDIVIGGKHINFDFRHKRWVWLLALLAVVILLIAYLQYQKHHNHKEALPLVQTEFTNNLAKLGSFYQGWARYNPAEQPFDLPPAGLETSIQRQSRMRTTFMEQLDFFQQIWAITATEQAVFKANERDLYKKAANNFNKAYDALDEFSYAVNSYINFFKDKINLATDPSELVREGENLYILKRTEAKIAIVNAVLEYGHTIESDDWILVRSLLRNFCILLESEKYPEIRAELLELQKNLYQNKTLALAGNYQPPACEQHNREVLAPPSVSQIDSTISDFSELISAACFPFLGGDSTAAMYYFDKALPFIKDNPTLLKFVYHSMHKLRQPDNYPEGLNIMVIQVKSSSKAAKAGIKMGDILYKINDHILAETAELGQLLGQTGPAETNLFYIYRDGQQLRLPVTGNDPLGMTLTSLGCFLPDIQ
jgi:hypothetical protein